jgi:hypothetical protein
MIHRPLVLAAMFALASATAVVADTPPAAAQTPQCTTDGVLPGSSAYLRCTYSPVRLLTPEQPPPRRATLADRRKSENDAQRQAAGAAAAVDMVRTIGVTQGVR